MSDKPAELAKLEALETFMRSRLRLDDVASMGDWVKLMHREFQGGKAEDYRIPDTWEQVAQLMLVNGDVRIHEFIDEGYRWARVLARAKETSAYELKAMFDELKLYLDKHFPASQGYEAQTTGDSRLYAELTSQLVRSQILSLSISGVLIFSLVFLMLCSIRAGLHSILPNALPILTTLGLMGWFGIRLDAATAMISTVALGIAVDDTIHFLQYLRSRLAEHGILEQGIKETLLMKGPAIFGTSVTITCGFGVLMASNFGATKQFGMLVCIAMIAALLGDLILLPAVLLICRSRLGIRPPSRPAPLVHEATRIR